MPVLEKLLLKLLGQEDRIPYNVLSCENNVLMHTSFRTFSQPHPRSERPHYSLLEEFEVDSATFVLEDAEEKPLKTTLHLLPW